MAGTAITQERNNGPESALAGRYSIERELGRGGMGIVYLAREVRLDRRVALKVMAPELAARPDLRERFLREARTAARLSHPHIVPIFAVDEVSDFVFMAMAYVEGETLEQRVRTRGPLSVREASRVLREVAWALGYAHSQGIIHRDIKPANILLEAGTNRTLVTDFGIAHVTDEPLGAELLGTPQFMSPEQIAGGAIDGRSDLYALGVVGYYVLSGRLPGEKLQAVAPEVPHTITQAIDRCLAHDPVARFADGAEIADAFGRALEQRTQIPQPIRLFRHQIGAALPGMVVMSGLALLLIAAPIIYGFDEIFGVANPTLLSGLLIGAAPIAMLLRMTRRLLRAGYDHDDLVRALRIEVEERRAAADAGPDKSERIASRFAIGGMLTGVANSIYLMLGPYFPAYETFVFPLMVGISTLSLGAGLFAAEKYMHRTSVPGSRWLKFWDSGIGRAITRIAGIKLERPLGAIAVNRPTEVAIGLAADRLFAELPAPLRSSIGDLPRVVQTLERHAETIRARIAQLELIAGAGDVRAAREAAEQRLAEVVAALENIRLNLLRLHGGADRIEQLTVDLRAAHALSADLARLVEAQIDADAVLTTPRPRRRTRGDTPVPA